MNSQLTQSLLPLLTLVLVASIVNSLIHLAFRALESKSRIVSGIISCLILIIFLSSSTSIFSSDFSIIYISAVIFALIGSVFHRKSIDKTTNVFLSFALMFSVNLFALVATFFVGMIFNSQLRVIQSANPKILYILWIFLIAQSITTPFIIWARKNSRLRPGIDKHFDD